MASVPPLLSVRRLRVLYPQRSFLGLRRAPPVFAVDDLHFDLYPGETLGVVGESGCGKSTLARTLVGLQPATSGSVRYAGTELVGLNERGWKPVRGEIQMVFQDPLASLNPKHRIIDIVAEPLRALNPKPAADERRARAFAMLARVGLGPEFADKRPGELSGGQAQRVAIARALVVKPKLLICDEPVSALDVSVQAQIINLLADLQREDGLAMVFIAHDLAVVRQLASRVLVMYLGKVMEQGHADEVYANPRHPYTRALLAAAPTLDAPVDGKAKKRRAKRESAAPKLPPMGCVFHTRCALAEHACVQSVPLLRRVATDQYAACHFIAAPSDA